MSVAVMTSLVLAGGPLLGDPAAWLESELRSRYTNVTEWRIREVLPPAVAPDLRVERLEVAAVGSRTQVVVHGRDAAGRAAVVRRWYQVTGLGPGLVATRPLGALTAVTADMLDLASVDVMAQSCDPLGDRSAAVGKRLLRSRQRGDALCASMLGAVPAVVRGKPVTVEATAGAVSLRATAVAAADADIGERVLLRRGIGKDPFWAVVTAAGEARIDE